MRDIDGNIIASMETLLTSDVIVWVVALTFLDGTALYLTPNKEPVTYLGFEYSPANMELPDFDDSGDGDLPSATMTIENVGRVAMQYLESSNRPWDQAKVIFQLAKTTDPSRNTKVRFELFIQSATANDKVVSLSLGTANWFDRLFPGDHYLRDTNAPGIPFHAQ